MIEIINLICAALLLTIYLNGISAQGDKGANVGKHDGTVMCYIGTWARYRKEDGFFDATAFDPKLCTHVIYSFVGLDPVEYTIKSLDTQADLNGDEGGKDGFKNVINLKSRHPGLKVLVAIGGWSQGSENYSIMASAPEKRKIFVQSVSEFLRKYKFDGLDVDWEYPTQRGGKPEDKQNFVALLQELHSSFKKNNWILSVAVGAPFYILDAAYDVPQITELVDYINIMTYDYHGKWDNKTGHNSPLYPRKDGHDKDTNIHATIQRYIAMGAKRSKINLGLAFYGRTFTLDDHKNPIVGSAAHEEGPKGPWTQEAGFMGYNELCQQISDAGVWMLKRDVEQRVPYAYSGETWISYDDALSISEKVSYTVSNHLGGVMIWSIDMDDIYGRCHKRPMHLLKTVNEAFMTGFNKTENEIPQQMPPDDDESDNEIDGHVKRNRASSANAHLMMVVGIMFTIGIAIFSR